VGVLSPERERAAPPPPAPPAGPPPRRGTSPWGLLTLGLVLLVLVGTVGFVRGLLPSFSNPFAAETVDRTAPAILRSIQDLSEFRAATANMEVIVDLEQETPLPDALLGERTLFVAVGSVDATVDFARLGEGAVSVSDDRRAATVTLPPPVLSDARLDLDRSYVYESRRGVLNRLGALFDDGGGSDREVYLAAERKLDEAARAESGLDERARENTRAMLRSLLGALGFERVDVRFE
jgi:hypothetical protein